MAVLKFDDFQALEVDQELVSGISSISATLIKNILRFSQLENLPKYKPTGTEGGGSVLVFDNGFEDYREHALYDVKSDSGVLTSELVKLDARRFRILRGTTGGGEIIINLTPLRGWEVEERADGVKINHARGSLFLDTLENKAFLERAGKQNSRLMSKGSNRTPYSVLFIYNRDKILVVGAVPYSNYTDNLIFIDFSQEALYITADSRSLRFSRADAITIAESNGANSFNVSNDALNSLPAPRAEAYSLTVFPSIEAVTGAPLLPFMQVAGRYQDAFPSSSAEPQYRRTPEGLFIFLGSSLLRVRGA